MKDLFGNLVMEKPDLTFEEKYQEYINSPAWRRIREAKIKLVGGRCEECGISKWSVKLEVHHKTYERFGHERMEDLLVLCPKCHIEEDQIRKIQDKETKLEKKARSPLVRGFEEWMDRGNNSNWRNLRNEYLEMSWKRFLEHLYNISGKRYEVKFWRSPNWH